MVSPIIMYRHEKQARCSPWRGLNAKMVDAICKSNATVVACCLIMYPSITLSELSRKGLTCSIFSMEPNFFVSGAPIPSI